MKDLLIQPLPAATSQDVNCLLVKLLHLLYDNGVNILEDHEDILLQHVTIKKDELEKPGDGQDNSSFPVLHADQNKNNDIHCIAAAYVDKKTTSGTTPLHLMAENGDTELLNIFITAGANVDAKNMDMVTPLHLSAMYDHREIVEILLKAGADANAEDSDKLTPLHFSALNGHTEIVEFLLKAGAAVDAVDISLNSPLHLSSASGHKEVVDILLKANCIVNAEDKYKITPLHLSALKGHKEIVEILLKAGARVDAQNKNKETSLLLCLKRHHKDVAEVLISAGASVNLQDVYGDCALDYMDSDMRVRFAPTPMPLGFSGLLLSMSRSVRSIWSYASETIETEHMETISATLKTVDGNIPAPVDSSSKTGFGPICAPTTAGQSSDLGDKVPQDLNSVSQQLVDYMSKFSLKQKEGLEESCSHFVKATTHDGRIVMPTTINITNIKNERNIYHCAPGSQLTFNQPQMVPINSPVVIYQGNQGTTATDDNEGDEDSSRDTDMEKCWW